MKKPLSLAGRSRFSLAAPLLLLPCCLLPAVFCLSPSVFAQGLFPSDGGKRSKDPIVTAPQPLNSTAASRDSAARRNGDRRSPGPRPDTVQLPYYLVWGDTTSRLASLVAGVGAKITNKKTAGPQEIWTVEGLIAPNLQSSLFTFQAGQLLALEFAYGQADWTLDKYNEQMGQFRRLLESKCEAPGELVSRGLINPPAAATPPAPAAAASPTPASPAPAAPAVVSPASPAPASPAPALPTASPAPAAPAATPDSTIKETLTGYQWKHGDTIVQLFYFAAEDAAKNQNFRSISVHYHYTDPYADQVPALDTAATGAAPGNETAPAVGAASTSNAADPAHPAPGVTVTPPRKLPKGSGKAVPITPENDPLPEH